jgi:hypothetical protein
VTLMKERSREEWQWAALESLLADLKLTLRRLRKSPGFAVTVLLTLAIGIGANTAVFSVVNSVLLKPLPYPDADKLASLWLDAPGANGLASFDSGLRLSPSMFLTFAERNRSFESMGIWTMRYANVTGIAQPDQANAALVSGGVLETLGVQPEAGQWFSAADQDPHGRKTVMLSYGYWQRRFGGDRGVVGRTIQGRWGDAGDCGGDAAGFRMVDQDFDLLLPMALDRAELKMYPFGYDGIGRLKPGVTLAQADGDLARLIPVWMDSWSNGPGTNSHSYAKWRITPNFRTQEAEGSGQHWQRALGGDGDGGTGDADCVHQRGQSAAGARGIAAAGACGTDRIGRGAVADCARVDGGECAAGFDGRRAFDWGGVCGAAAAGGYWSGRFAAHERDCAGWKLAGIHAGAVGFLRIVLRIDSSAQISADEFIRCADGDEPHGERQPVAQSLAQCAGGGAGGDGAGAACKCAADDSDLCGAAQC